MRTGHGAEALPICHSAVTSLAVLKGGTTPDLMAPCLDVYAEAANQQKDRAQDLLAEMFTAAQLGQGGITSQQIAQASATLAENARDPKVGDAIRQQRDLKGKLDNLLSQRDDLTQTQRQGTPTNPGITAQAAALDKQIAETRAKMADADAALQAASPNYGQLVQQVVSAKDVFAALHPAEAFASITLANQDGRVFLLRNDTVTVSKIAAGLPAVAGLVKRIREGIELSTAGLPPFDIADAMQLYKLTLGGVAPQLEGVKALVVAPSGPLLSLPFELMLAHLIHRIAGIRWRAWYNGLESLRDWVLTPTLAPGQNLPCPPTMTIRSCRSLCQASAKRRSPRRSTAA